MSLKSATTLVIVCLSINLILGFIIASSLISAILVWNESSTKLAILDSFEDKDYEIVIVPKSGLSNTHILDEVENWLNNRSIIEQTAQLYQSPIIFGTEGLDDSVKLEDAHSQRGYGRNH